MSNRIQEFFNEKFGEVRAVTINGIVYFFGVDITRMLGYSNGSKAINTHCKRALREIVETSNSQNGRTVKGPVLLIAKSDIYRLIVRSKLDSTEEFESWVFDEILPSIEGTGTYVEPGREEEMVSKYFPSFSKDIQTEMVNDLIRQNRELKEFYNGLINSEGLLSINTCAKELGIGEYTLFAFLRKFRVFFYDKDKVNVPYERFRKEGKFVVRETLCHDGNYRSVTYATKKGLDYMRKLLQKKGFCEKSFV